MNIKKLAYTALASSVLAVCAAPANATLILTLDAGGGNVRTIVDGGAGDTDGTAGAIRFVGSIGTWIGNITAALSNSPGANDLAFLDLASANATSRSGGTLTITLIDDGFTNPSGLGFATTSVNGWNIGTTANGSGSTATFNAFLNNANIGTLGAYGSNGNFSGTTGTGVDTTGGFTLKQVVTITHQGAGVTAFNLLTTTVPEPATLGLLGLGLIGLGFVRRRRMG